MTEFDVALGGLLRQWREEAGLSQRALADLLGDDQAFISRLESGRRHIAVEALLSYLSGIGSSLDEKASAISALVPASQAKSLWRDEQL